MLNNTQITPPRVPITDQRTGAVSREWYRWFFSQYTVTGGGTGITPVTNGGTGFGSYVVGDLLYANTTTTLEKLADVAIGNALISGGVGVAPTWGKIGLTIHVSGVLPIANGGTNGSSAPTAGAVPYGTGTAYGFTAAGTSNQVLTSAGAGVPTWKTPDTLSAPVVKTADFTVADGEAWLINNKLGSTCTVTLPAAASWVGRQLIFKNIQAQTIVSASSDVVPITSTIAGTAILLGVIGNWATLVSDGTNWIIMQTRN